MWQHVKGGERKKQILTNLLGEIIEIRNKEFQNRYVCMLTNPDAFFKKPFPYIYICMIGTCMKQHILHTTI